MTAQQRFVYEMREILMRIYIYDLCKDGIEEEEEEEEMDMIW